jgi:hypothetical protein
VAAEPQRQLITFAMRRNARRSSSAYCFASALPSLPDASALSDITARLTKSYTQDGMVVFADLCTKESAAAPVDGRAADATPAPQGPSAPPAPAADDKASDATPMQNPSNFAGRTYKDFLAANGLPMPQGAQGN